MNKNFFIVILILITGGLLLLNSQKFFDVPAPNNREIEKSLLNRFEKLDERLGQIETLLDNLANPDADPDKKTPAKKPSELPKNEEDDVSKNLEEFKNQLSELTKDQEELIRQLLDPPIRSRGERRTIIKNQKIVNDLVKDVQFAQSPVHRLLLGEIRELDVSLTFGADQVLKPVFDSFPVELHFATPRLRTSARVWNRDTNAIWQILKNSQGIFNLHILFEDFIKHGDDFRVKTFLQDIRSRSHIILYHPDLRTFLTNTRSTKTLDLLKTYQPHLRIRIGPDHARLAQIRNITETLSFLEFVLR